MTLTLIKNDKNDRMAWRMTMLMKDNDIIIWEDNNCAVIIKYVGGAEKQSYSSHSLYVTLKNDGDIRVRKTFNHQQPSANKGNDSSLFRSLLPKQTDSCLSHMPCIAVQYVIETNKQIGEGMVSLQVTLWSVIELARAVPQSTMHHRRQNKIQYW